MSSLILLTAGLVAGLAAGLAGSGSLLLAPALVLVLPRWPMPVGGVLLGLLLGSVGPDARAPRSVADLHLPARYLVEAQVRTASPPTATGQTALLAVATIDGRECRGVGIRLHLPTPELLPGDRIEGTLRLSRPPAPRNPGEVDRRARALRAGIHLRAWADAPGQVRVLARSRSMSGLVARLRHAAARRLDRQLPPRDAGLARALVLGDRSAITGADRRLFARTGQGHLIAVSGLHVGLVLAASLFLLGRLGVPLSGRWLCGLLLVAFYVPFAGAAPSTVRAGAGAALYFGGCLLGRRAAPLTVLATVVFAVLLLTPQRLGEPAFTFSVGAVLGILALHRRLQGLLIARPVLVVPGLLPPPRTPVRTALALSLSAWLGTSPLLVAVIGRLCLVAAPLSVLTVPLTAGLIGASFLVLLPIPGVEAGGEIAFGLTARVLRALLGGVVSLRLDARPAAPFGAIWYAVYATCFAVASLAPREASRLALLGLALLLVLAVAPRSATPPAVPRVWLLSVGEGQAAIVLLPDGRTALIDAGRLGDPSVGRRLVVPALRALGVARIDVAVASHPDADHTGGLADVHAEYPIPRLHVAPGMRDSLVGCSRTIHEARRGDVLLAGPWGVLEVRAPAISEPAGGSDNDAGLVVRLETAAGVRMLFPGDREATGIERWLAAEDDPTADVLLLPHHGHPDPGRETARRVSRPALCLASCGPGSVPALPPDTWATATSGALSIDLLPSGPRVTTPWRPRPAARAYHARPLMPVLAPTPLFPAGLGVALGLLVVACLSVRPFGWLRPGGAAGAGVLGLAAWTAFGWAGLAALFAPFVVASLLGRLPGSERSEARSLRQVAANGLPALLGCVLALVEPALASAGAAFFLGALACLGADTSATEIGVRYGGDPRTLARGRTVRRGESGGVTNAGLLASLGGAALAPLAYAAFAGFPSAGRMGALLFAGAGGALLDSLLGATWEYKGPGEGLCYLDNDGVNLVSVLAAAFIALALAS